MMSIVREVPPWGGVRVRWGACVRVVAVAPAVCWSRCGTDMQTHAHVHTGIHTRTENSAHSPASPAARV
jgi:hypothetical protein